MDTINGVVVGLVTQVQAGQIKVTYPWLSEDHESDWIRIATAMSGNNRGSFLMPELQDEVLLAFDQGNPRCPYVIGFLWNGQDLPPGQDPRDRRLMSKNGHRLQFLELDPVERRPWRAGHPGRQRQHDRHVQQQSHHQSQRAPGNRRSDHHGEGAHRL